MLANHGEPLHISLCREPPRKICVSLVHYFVSHSELIVCQVIHRVGSSAEVIKRAREPYEQREGGFSSYLDKQCTFLKACGYA